MATTKKLADIKAQIAELQREAEELVSAEKANLIADMKAKIADYGITASELGYGGGSTRVATQSRTVKIKAPAMYRNKEGLTWSGGRGPKPKWVKEVTESGGDIEQYRI